jgi:hypothetical protein
MKKHKKQIQLVQVNFTYGNNAYLPYSIGLLHANLLIHTSVSANYEVLPPIYLRSNIEEISNSCFATDIIGI